MLTMTDFTDLNRYVKQLIALRNEIKTKQDDLKCIEKEERKISGIDIPEIMQEMGISSYTHESTNSFVAVKPFISASLKSEKAILKSGDPASEKNKKEEALQYIRSIPGAESIIKHELKVELKKIDTETLEQVKDFLQNRNFYYEIDETVHNATLKSFLNERLASNEHIPADAFNLFIGKKTFIKIKEE